MSIDSSRIVRLLTNARKVNAITVNPSDTDQARQAAVRKLTDEIMRKSHDHAVLVAWTAL